MQVLLLVGAAVGLAMDACAVAISRGIAIREPSWRQAATMGMVFGFFQAAMPCIGYAAGLGAKPYIEAVDHWVAFILLAIIGGKMWWEGWSMQEDINKTNSWPTMKTMLLLGIATSIDALAAGVTLVTMDQSLWLAVLIIGTVTALLSTLCAHFARHLGNRFGRYADMFGGVLLVGLGTWILISHLTGIN